MFFLYFIIFSRTQTILKRSKIGIIATRILYRSTKVQSLCVNNQSYHPSSVGYLFTKESYWFISFGACVTTFSLWIHRMKTIGMYHNSEPSDLLPQLLQRHTITLILKILELWWQWSLDILERRPPFLPCFQIHVAKQGMGVFLLFLYINFLRLRRAVAKQGSIITGGGGGGSVLLRYSLIKSWRILILLLLGGRFSYIKVLFVWI